jgi:DNA mismatch repair ATPase MutS
VFGSYEGKNNDGKNNVKESAVLHVALHNAHTSDAALDATHTLYAHLCDLLKTDGLNDDIDYIRDGYDAQIDELRQIAYHSDSLLLAYQQELVTATGITNIKIKYVSNQ